MTPDAYTVLPAPWWLVNSLHLLTLTLHFLAMNILVGGLIIGLVGRFSDRWRHPEVARLIKLLPTAMAATVTFGVAPLLFLQLVYGRLIYAASIVSGWYWLLIIVAGIVGYYCLYTAAFSDWNNNRLGLLLWLALLCFAYISVVYSSVFALAERPELMQALYSGNQAGTAFNSDIGSYLYRWLHMIAGAVTVGGFFVALVGRQNDQTFALGKRFFLWGMIVAMVLGVVYLMTLGEYIRPYMRSSAVWWLLISVLLSLGSLHFLFKRRFLAAGSMLFVSVLGMVINRHIVRLLHLEGAIDPASMPVNSQWSVIIVFFVCLIMAIGAIWYMLRLYFSPQDSVGAAER